jgi:hypothetical protein
MASCADSAEKVLNGSVAVSTVTLAPASRAKSMALSSADCDSSEPSVAMSMCWNIGPS